MLVVLLSMLLSASTAQAAVTHELDPLLTAKLAEGVPAGAAGEGALTGPLSGVSSLGVDGGQLWVAERIEAGPNLGRSRVDRFDDHSGEWIAPQLDEERSVTNLQTGVAAGHAGGEAQTYVGGGVSGQNVVAVFGPGGKIQPEGIWEGLSTPEKGFGILEGLAVDHSPSLETQGDVYVATGDLIDVYPGQSGGTEPPLLGQILGAPEAPSSAGHFAEVRGVAVSPLSGDVLVADGRGEECAREKAECAVDVFEPAPGLPGTYTFLFKITGPPGQPFKRIGPIAVDGEGEIYVVEKEANVVDQFSPAGQYRGQLRGSEEGAPFKSLRSIAADPESDELFVGDFDPAQEAGAVDAFGPSLVLPDVSSEAASEVKVDEAEGRPLISARANGSIDPLGEGEASCRLAWGESEAFGQIASCPAVPNGSGPVARSATLEGLEADTTYFFRMQAGNKNGLNPGEAAQTQQFKTPGPGIHSASVAEVTADSATLHASIDPNEAPTSYYFQYGRSAGSYEASIPAPPGEAIGAGSGDVQVTPRHIQGLSPATVYHYRVVAVSTLEAQGKVKALSFEGPEQSFQTQEASGSGSILPDGRRWELVSPADKHGALLAPISETGVIQAAASGASVSYLANVPTEEAVKGYYYEAVQVLSERGAAGGWSSLDISLPHSSTSGLPVGIGKEYRFFSPDLCTAVVEPFGLFTSLAPEVFPPDSERTPYLRHSCACPSSPSSCYEPLLTGAAGYGDVPAGTEFGGIGTQVGAVSFLGASADAQHVILASEGVKLTSEARGTLYEFSAEKPPAERLQLISLLPANGEGKQLPALGAALGVEDGLAAGAVSTDGSRVVFSDGEAHLYQRDTVSGETVQLDVPEAGCGECSSAGGARYRAASADGSRVLFTDTQRLSANAGRLSGEADLYECRIEAGAGGPRCQLSDLTPAPGAGKGADVQGALLGASEDGAWAYFVANGVLGDGGARGASQGDCTGKGFVGEGACSLYVEHEGAVHYIARVAGADLPDWLELPNQQTARVSPDGRRLAFMSKASLTGYDNRDANSGQPDEEVYLYSQAADRLACASCDPSGARPVGVEYEKLNNGLVGGGAVWPPSAWIAANVPGWTPYELQRARYQSRYLSDSGRLFFNSSDALVAQDINNNQDVYQFEPAGVGDCASASPSYIPLQSGCLALISSGRAAGESGFLDASENGDDVFFLTGERLVAGDKDGARDLYDAHVCSAQASCPEEAQLPPPCSTAESCRAAPTPQPSIFGAPSSASFSGAGNLAPPPATVKKPTPAQLLRKALQSCRVKYKNQKKRRLSCEAQARKRYAPKASKPKRKAKRRGKR